ncbi:MAG: SpoVA/SpoVAEb family sporulation membrane protein [Clostridia bacterium]|nr:SpoVA/SpoVAEb family sporulation membrane protein [Clostridia bacterium]
MNTNMSKEAYLAYVKRVTPASPLGKDLFFSFLVGGAICTVGQLFSHFYLSMNLGRDAASTATSITMIFLGAALTALNLYDDLAKVGGAGTIIPITGFANSIVSPAMEFKSEGLVLGLAAKMFVVAGPVLVYGILTSSIYGLVLLLMQRL